MPPLPSWLSMR